MKILESLAEIDAFIKTITDGFVVLFLTTSWCAKCKLVKPEFEKVFATSSRAAVVSLDTDAMENDEISKRFDAKKLPLMVVVSFDGSFQHVQNMEETVKFFINS